MAFWPPSKYENDTVLTSWKRSPVDGGDNASHSLHNVLFSFTPPLIQSDMLVASDGYHN
jgi:hypothetical protein